MCGITGFIGRSKNIDLSYKLLTKLFERSDIRGIDAAGVWATEYGVGGSVIYHKEPIRSSKFIKNRFWLDLERYDLDLVIAHARGASKGVGEPFFNENNHPFTSTDRSIAVAHNGRIDDEEYYEIRKCYEVSTACDSEIILRIIEASLEKNDLEENKEINAIRDLFSVINEGHMAVAFGKRGTEGSRSLFLFRNEHRPLWISDLREELGQVFFVSEPSIWESACESCEDRILSNCYKLHEVQPQEVWEIRFLDNEILSKRYEVEKQEYYLENKDYFKIPIKQPKFNVISNLDENDQIIKEEEQQVLLEEYDIESLKECSRQIIEKIESINVELTSMASKGIIEKYYFESILLQLKNKEEEITKLLSVLYT